MPLMVFCDFFELLFRLSFFYFLDFKNRKRLFKYIYFFLSSCIFSFFFFESIIIISEKLKLEREKKDDDFRL